MERFFEFSLIPSINVMFHNNNVCNVFLFHPNPLKGVYVLVLLLLWMLRPFFTIQFTTLHFLDSLIYMHHRRHETIPEKAADTINLVLY